MIIPYTGSIIPFDRRPCPDPSHPTNTIGTRPGLVEGYEKRSTLSPENSTVQDLRDQPGEIIIAGGNRAIVHVITDVRSQPHEVGSSHSRAKIGNELSIRKTRMSRICRDDIRASRCIIPYVRIEYEWVVAGGLYATSQPRSSSRISIPSRPPFVASS